MMYGNDIICASVLCGNRNFENRMACRIRLVCVATIAP